MSTVEAVVLSERAATRGRLALAAMALCAVTIWVLQHPYGGVVHDSTLYALFALTRVHPDLASDIFLRFGSQDSYTLFTPLYTAAIAEFGLERAAALLTLIFQCGLLLGAWALGRRFMPPLAATLGVALLLAVPGEYGSADFFHIIEGFLTPRLPAEALVVGGLAAGLSQRYWTAAFCVAAAMTLHPIIGCAGAAMLILTFVGARHPKLLAAAGAVALLAAVATVMAVTPLGRLQGAWMLTVRSTSGYLFIGGWHTNDWSRIAVPLAILTIGMLNGTAPLLRRVCAAALVMVACGLLITVIFCDLLHVSIFVSAQTWRWLWLADLIAFVLTPAIAADCWRRGDSGRIAILVLLSAWIFRGTPTTLYLLPLAIACAAVPDRWTTHRNWRLIFLGACLLVGLAAVLDLSDRLSYLPARDASVSVLAQRARSVCGDGVMPVMALIGAWLLLRRSESIARVAAVATLAVLTCGALLPLAWGEWTNAHYTPELASRFESWRAAIPARAEVLWPDTPIGSWYLLERPSYWSMHQAAGAIFSQEKALFIQHRTDVVAKAVEKSSLTLALGKASSRNSTSGLAAVPRTAARINLKGMEAACSDPDLSYIVSWMPLAPTPYPPVTVDGRKLNGKLYLYRCADLLH